jgi:ubiquinone/menaquinone biosynthesis C-methylase UbiE
MNEKYEPFVKRDSTRLYSKKAIIYANSRPDYAPGAFTAFQNVAKLPRQSVVLDVGSGTGMLTRHLLHHFDTVYALEPTQEMRKVAEKDLNDHPGFHSLNGMAEDIPLPDHSVDLVTVGQAIHWFQPVAALAEFQRVAQPNTWLLLAHIKSLDETLNKAIGEIFKDEYGCLPLDEHPPSNQVPNSFYFADGKHDTLQFPHTSEESWERFLGGISSAAYAPDRAHPRYGKFVHAVREIFDDFSQRNLLKWKIATEISFGLLTQPTTT